MQRRHVCPVDREQRGRPTTPGRETNLSRCRDTGSEAQVSPDRGETDDASHFRAVSPLPSRPPSPSGTPTSLVESHTPGGTHTLLGPHSARRPMPQGDRMPPGQPGSGPCAFLPSVPSDSRSGLTVHCSQPAPSTHLLKEASNQNPASSSPVASRWGWAAMPGQV